MVVLGLWCAAAAAASTGAAASAKKRANIVLILTDDQDVVLNAQLDAPLGPMAQTKALLQDQGAFGVAAYVNVPICCPSRANMLSGRYAHNLRDGRYEPFPRNPLDPSGVDTGVGTCGDEAVEALTGKPLPCGCMRMNISSYGGFENSTFAPRLQREAGYATAYFGKYLNPPAMVRYCRNETLGPMLPGAGWPAGWDVFYGMCDQASTPAGGYYDVNWVDSEARALTYTGSAPHEYTTSVIGNKTAAWIGAHVAAHPGQPFLAVAATRAPHAPYLPPPWYAGRFGGVTSPRSLGSWNASAAGKAPWMRANLPLSPADADHFDEVQRRRWGALLAVDDLVAGVVDALDAAGALADTYVFYTSDHGYHLGSFRLAEGKMHFYETDTKVPFAVRGPGVPAGFTLDRLIGNVDLAPTFLDIAGLGASTAHPPMDGRSILPLITAPPPPTTTTPKTTTPPSVAPSERAAAADAAAAAAAAPCDPDPCHGHGVCLAPLAPQCFCNTGFAGATCDRCAAGREAFPACRPVAWREQFLFEYYPIANYPTSAAVAAHKRLNDGPDNTFRALRVRNATHDLVFAELTTLADWQFGNVSWRELYDMRADPFQLANLAGSAEWAPRLPQLHADLVALWTCAGSTCP